jgi:dihydroflavonol-4-reductase
MKNVLVTGGTGFIGSNLASKLVALGYRVRILRRENSDLRAIDGIAVDHSIGDVREVESLVRAMTGCDTVFHTAAMVTFERRSAREQYQVNVLGTRNVVEACIATGVARLVHTSSVAAIGQPPVGGLANEETEFRPARPGADSEETGGYRSSKHFAEREILAGISRGLWAVIVNPSVVVGERDIHFHGGQMIRDIKKGRIPFSIRGGMNVVYVGDVVQGHISAAIRGRSGERYILGGENLTHDYIFTRIAALVGGRAPFARIPIAPLRLGARAIESISTLIGVKPLITADLVAGAGKYNWYSLEKAARELDYKPSPFDTAIRSAYNWYTEHGLI